MGSVNDTFFAVLLEVLHRWVGKCFLLYSDVAVPFRVVPTEFTSIAQNSGRASRSVQAIISTLAPFLNTSGATLGKAELYR